jgi:hypothetical protein
MRRKVLNSRGDGLHSGARQAVCAIVGDEAENDRVATRLATVQNFWRRGIHQALG